MERTQIQYRKLMNNKVEIISWSNIAYPSQLEQEFGIEVRDEYLGSGVNAYPRYYARTGGFILEPGENIIPFNIWGGAIVSKLEFDYMAEHMKLAGERLQEIIEYYKNLNNRTYNLII